MERVLMVDDGRSVSLGAADELDASLNDIMDATGGSSGQGQFSVLFGLTAEGAMPADMADRLSQEAGEFRTMCGAGLRPETLALLDRLVGLAGSDRKD